MYADAPIPVIQLSMLSGLDPAAHIEMGAGSGPATRVFNDLVLDKRTNGYTW